MTNTNLHGGDLDEISRIYNINKADILNFSGNVNPLGLPVSVKEAIKNNIDICTNYPDASYLQLRQAISHYAGVNYEHIMIGNGSTELISGFIRYVHPKKAVIISPAYSEYLNEIKAVNGKAILFELKEEDDFVLNIQELINILSDDVDMLVICNPNNPTGSFLSRKQLKIIFNHCQQNSINVMIDETYVEFSSPEFEVSAMPLAKEYDNVFIIRGTSKFFACPGLRLGYAVCSNEQVINHINSGKDLWSVNVFADLAGRTMFTDKKFISDSIKLINQERIRFFKELGCISGIKLYNTQSNFILAKILKQGINSDYVFNTLIKESILVRNCSNFPFLGDCFIRFCILDKENNSKLINSLLKILRG